MNNQFQIADNPSLLEEITNDEKLNQSLLGFVKIYKIVSLILFLFFLNRAVFYFFINKNGFSDLLIVSTIIITFGICAYISFSINLFVLKLTTEYFNKNKYFSLILVITLVGIFLNKFYIANNYSILNFLLIFIALLLSPLSGIIIWSIICISTFIWSHVFLYFNKIITKDIFKFDILISINNGQKINIFEFLMIVLFCICYIYALVAHLIN